MRLKKNVKKFTKKVQDDAATKLQSAIQKQKAKTDARDDIIRSAERAIIAARGRNGGKATHGDVQEFANKYIIKREELRTTQRPATC